jgi:prepilin-type N-terminal cleavage/methylation domain-containing protein
MRADCGDKRSKTMVYNNNIGFTLFELLIATIIVAILAAIGLPSFVKTKEHSVGSEAIANLKLIAFGERNYRIENGSYYPATPGTDNNLSTINSNLRLFLPTSSARNWNYSVTDTAAPSFSATATRTASNNPGSYAGCTYTINDTTEVPATSTCP